MRRRRPGRVAGDRVVRPGPRTTRLSGAASSAARTIAMASSSAPRRSPGPRTDAAHPGDRVPERASPDPELEPSAAHDIERRGGLREHRGRAHRQAGDIREEAQAFGPREEVRDERERIEEATLVGWSWMPTSSSPPRSAARTWATMAAWSSAVGVTAMPKAGVMERGRSPSIGVHAP